MSALGQKRTLKRASVMSALPPKADIAQRGGNARFVPIADIHRPTRSPSSARLNNGGSRGEAGRRIVNCITKCHDRS